MRSRAVIWGVLLVIGLIVSYFTVSGGDAVKWNDKVVAIDGRFAIAWTRIQPIVNSWIQGNAIDLAQFDRALAQYTKDVGQAAGELRRELPPDDELCKSMHTELVKYADLEEAQLGDIQKLAAEMKASNPGKPADLKRVAEALDALGRKEMDQEAVVKAKQTAMATKFKLKLK